MVGVGMEPPALPSAAGLAARLTAHGVRPRRISAKRSWLPGCGRLGVDGRDDEAVAPAAAPLMAQNGGAPPLLGQAKEEEAAPAVISSASQNNTIPQLGQDNEVKAAATPVIVSSAAQKSALPRQGQNKAEGSFASAAVSVVEHNGVLQHTLPQQELELVGEEGDKWENSEIGSSINDAYAASLDGQEGNRTTQIATPMVVVLESSISGASSYEQNGVRDWWWRRDKAAVETQ
jgi:[histone H3]-lysine9 N-trimethyltransferase EHMT